MDKDDNDNDFQQKAYRQHPIVRGLSCKQNIYMS